MCIAFVISKITAIAPVSQEHDPTVVVWPIIIHLAEGQLGV